MSDFKTKKTAAGCLLALMSIFVMYPLNWIYTYLLLSYVNAPREIWVIYFVSVPVSLVVGMGLKMLEIFTEKE